MKQRLWVLIIASIVLNCKPQQTKVPQKTKDTDTKTTQSQHQKPTPTQHGLNRTIIKEIDIQYRKALNYYLITLLQDKTNDKRWDNDKINKLLEYLKVARIQEMLENIKTVEKIQRKIKTQLQYVSKFIYDEEQRKSVIEDLDTRFTTAIETYQAELKKTISHEDFEDLKTSIESISIEDIEEIDKEINRITDADTIIQNIYPHKLVYRFNYFKRFITNNRNGNIYTHDKFNQFIIAIEEEGLTDILNKIHEQLTKKENTQTEISKINDSDTNKKTFKKTLNQANRNFHNLIKEAFEPDKTQFDDIKEKIIAIKFDEFDTLYTKVKQYVENPKPSGTGADTGDTSTASGMQGGTT
ncbi:BTA121 domain-containing protein surface lipoprotein [Borrelia persica]|uniref:BTA121 domain-containing protein surface lipoprotein n=1 Tax=Borrelia persica TaxID=44448 RepID=UPI0004631F55|nr:hypothetical protein [Borrelia persica]